MYISTLQAYEDDARKTANWNEAQQQMSPVVYCTLGLVGESGEFADKIKKTIRNGYHVSDVDVRKDLLLELGDTLWYLSNLAVELGSSLQEVAELNIVKLRDRQARNVIAASGDHR